jgi:shikimate dehydrogenase
MSQVNCRRCGVIGNPISHSLSPQLHLLFSKWTGVPICYEKILAENNTFESQVNDFFETGGVGLNVTLPFKMHAFDIAKQRKPLAEEAKASNTLFLSNDILTADNTDGVGLIQDVSQTVDLKGARILILGAGGAVRGILPALSLCHPASITVMNRTADKVNSLMNDFPGILPFCSIEKAPFDLIINALSLMVETFNLPPYCFHDKTIGYDLSYDLTRQTSFVDYMTQQKLSAFDGFGMLCYQAAASFYIWHDVRPEMTSIVNIRQQILT